MQPRQKSLTSPLPPHRRTRLQCKYQLTITITRGSQLWTAFSCVPLPSSPFCDEQNKEHRPFCWAEMKQKIKNAIRSYHLLAQHNLFGLCGSGDDPRCISDCWEKQPGRGRRRAASKKVTKICGDPDLSEHSFWWLLSVQAGESPGADCWPRGGRRGGVTVLSCATISSRIMLSDIIFLVNPRSDPRSNPTFQIQMSSLSVQIFPGASTSWFPGLLARAPKLHPSGDEETADICKDFGKNGELMRALTNF